MMGAHVTLVMIVRNEASVIDRCLASVRPLIDHWVIVDTGSTDDTRERIRTALADIPGELHDREWVDFGHNRTELLALARDHGEWLLLVDADMTIRIEGGPSEALDPARLAHADAWSLRHDADPAYWIPRLIRADLDWRFVGSTHEYLDGGDGRRGGRHPALVIEDHADGGSRSDKFERDRRLLERSLADDPDDARAMFYLAQTLRDLGRTDEAIAMYRRRVAAGGWMEEVFYAQFQVGRLLIPTDPDAAIIELLEAWNMRPTRAEPLLELARLHRSRGEYSLAELHSSTGLEIGRTDDAAFSHSEPQDWGLRFERSIARYHLGDPTGALADNDRLISDGVPDHIRPWVLHNRAWCLHALDRPEPSTPALLASDGVPPMLGELVDGVTFAPVEIDVDPSWSRFNPSIADAPDGGLVMNVRSSNYRIGPSGAYEYEDGTPVIRTINHLVHLDDTLAAIDIARMPEIPPGAPTLPSRVLGCEDVRLVHTDTGWFGTATVRDRNPVERCEIALLTIPSITDPSATSLEVLTGPIEVRHEKNWMPFVVDGELRILYLCGPTFVGRIDEGRLELVSRDDGSPVLSGWRGGSQGIEHRDGWLFVVHEVSMVDERRVYTHRFVHLVRRTDRWVIAAATRPFTFRHIGIEFCAGLATQGDDLLASFGVDDAEAWIARIPRSSIDELLVTIR